jgi:hypothetical protein
MNVKLPMAPRFLSNPQLRTAHANWRPRVCALAALLPLATAFATNPLIMDQFTADPTARVFEGKVYVYPSHDIPTEPGKGRPGWFCMEDYHVFSSDNLTDWKDHGVIVSQTNVAWVNATTYSMWAPDCVFKNGKYYFFFPAVAKAEGFRIGVAIADKPDGPFKPEAEPIEGVRGIDPCVFIDKDGSAYLFYSAKKIYAVKLKDSLLALDGTPAVIDNLPTKGLLEGAFVFERNGIYYLTYPHVENTRERLEYSTSAHPLGPYQQRGVIMDESPTGCWTVHHSIVEYQGQWYLFYHDKDLSPDFDKNRSIRADRLYFDNDGAIKKVVPTLRGVGIVEATRKLQIDRYSAVSEYGTKVSFLDQANPREGWSIALEGAGSWVRFDQVHFKERTLNKLIARGVSSKGGVLEVHLDGASGPLLGKISFEKGSEWQVVRTKLENVPSGLHDLFVMPSGNAFIDVDWISFE